MRLAVRFIASIVMATALLAAGAGLTVTSANVFREGLQARGVPDIELEPLAARSEIVAADGSLLDNLYEEDRVPIALEAVPTVLVDAVVATEDAAFFDHEGISARGVLRALRANVTSGEVSQGGSTITQQLVKLALLDGERSYDRKAKEAVLAVRMEEEYTKHQILERYLNTVYFGAGAHGVVAAAERFFAKPVADLTLPEAALLAGLISSPEAYDPFRHREAARERRAHVLGRMAELGRISKADADGAAEAELPADVHVRQAQPTRYFTEEVRRRLLADVRLGATPQERFTTVFRGGIRVETTFDPVLQAHAEHAVRSTLPASPFTAALVAIDPSDGAVEALVGGPGFEDAKYNLATQGARQAGSSFKTLALAAWIADGRSPEDIVDATAPCTFEVAGADAAWNVDNYDGGSGVPGILSLRDATIKSSNCAYARLALVLGADKIVAMAKRLGISRELPPYPSVVLGSGEVSPLEMASVYATLAADGVRHEPVFIRRVLDRDGHVLLENAPVGEQVIPSHVARTVTDVLRGVVDRGTGTRAAIDRVAAGKTGTAQEWRDAWFAGYVPQLAAAVWMGSPTGQESMKDVAGVSVTGGSYPAMIWSAFMRLALDGVATAEFAQPDPASWPAPIAIGSMPLGVPLPPGVTLPPGSVIVDPATGLTVTTTTAPTESSGGDGGDDDEEKPKGRGNGGG